MLDHMMCISLLPLYYVQKISSYTPSSLVSRVPVVVSVGMLHCTSYRRLVSGNIWIYIISLGLQATVFTLPSYAVMVRPTYTFGQLN